MAELLNNIFGLAQHEIAGGKALYSMVATHPDKMEVNQCLPHIDSYVDSNLACVHYLCGKEQGGTSLYRHKKQDMKE